MKTAALALGLANPFPGLRSFEPEEDYLFFGRERRIDELLTKLRHTHLLSVVGGSGSGKSSLVRAGLVPALYGGNMVGTGSHWRVAVLRPGEEPIGRLAQALVQCELVDDAEVNGGGKAIIEATLRRSSLGLVEAYRLADLSPRTNLLVVVDQFEELFRYRAAGKTNYGDDAVAFVKLLLSASQEIDPRIYVALTMRSDFIGSCADYPGLPPVVSRGQYLVPRMTRAEMREAIVGPIGVAHEEIAPRLVVRLLNEAGEDPDQLPVLQHALMRTFEYWKHDHSQLEPIDIRHYEAIGTMSRALSLHADETFAELKSDRRRGIATKAFKALTETDGQGRGIRRPTTLGSICEIGNFDEDEVKQVVEKFREPGRAFLAPPPSISLERSTVIDLAHESIMRVWNRLQGWVLEEQQASKLYLRLAESADCHVRGEQSLWRNPELAVGLQWLAANAPNSAWAARYRPGFEQATFFLNESQRADKKRRLLQWIEVSALVLIALATLATYGLVKQKENTQLRATNQQLNQSNDRLQNEVKTLRSRLPHEQAAAPPPTIAPPAPPSEPEPSAKIIPKTKPSVSSEIIMPPILSEFAGEMLRAHNIARQVPGVPALVWSSELAAKAQRWADTLAATGESKMEGIPGQNIAYAGPPGTAKPGFIVSAWAAEVKNFDYEKNACVNPSLKCYHYTQVVWSESKYVGCATAHDAQRDIWVCDYDPPGNLIGARPY
jgi:uncharacterized protein YkwD